MDNATQEVISLRKHKKIMALRTLANTTAGIENNKPLHVALPAY